MILTVTLNAAIDKRYVVENLQLSEVNRIIECSYTAGGKGLNVSRVASIAGEKVIATGFVGGHAGEYIIEQIEKQKIQNAFIKVKGESRSCINIYDITNHTQTEFLEPGLFVDNSSQEELLKMYQELVQTCDVVTISGSLPQGCDQQIYQKLVSLAKEAGKKVIVDASGNLLQESIKAKPTMIKPNIDEIKALTGMEGLSREELITAAKTIVRSGVEIVAISLGKEGTLTVCEEGVYQVTVPKIDVINTVGCGDSMVAGFAIGLARKMPLEEILKFASAISVANAMQLETGFFVKEEMEKILPLIRVKLIKKTEELNEGVPT